MIVRAEHPERAAAALAALLGAPSSISPGGRAVGGRITVLPAESSASIIERLPLPVARTVEQVIEIACMHGFHAEELGRSGLVEFWIGEAMAVELVTSDARTLPALAA